jgi:hypothetical protein
VCEPSLGLRKWGTDKEVEEEIGNKVGLVSLTPALYELPVAETYEPLCPSLLREGGNVPGTATRWRPAGVVRRECRGVKTG